MALRARRTAGHALRTRQCGYGLLLALVILVLGSLYGLTRGLSQATAQTKHDDHDQAVLRQARDALIAYAARRPTRPGALPCPDLNDNGVMGGNHPTNAAWNVAEAFGNACDVPQNRTGRLPWATLELPDLRDSTGERLWYAMSSNFRNIAANRINSDTRGQLTITGLAPQNEVIAIVFAPGAALAGQVRTRATAAENIASNYLEGENGDTTNDTFTALTECRASDCTGGPFNDKLLVIRASDLFPVVENMVARRLQTETRDFMFKEGASFADKGHFQRWRDHSTGTVPPTATPPTMQGYFPFAAPFVQPDTSNFRGAWNTPNGLMPVTKEATFVGWDLTPSAYKPSVVKVSGVGNVTSVDCDTSSTAAVLSCNVEYEDSTALRIRLTGYALNVAMSFVDPVQTGDVKFPSGGGNLVSVSNTHVTTGPPPQGSAQIEVVVDLALRANSSTVATTITVDKPPYNTNVVGPNWFIDNNWHRVTLYSVAPVATTALPKDVGTGNPDCLLAGADCRDALSTVNGGTGRHLVLLLSGLPVDNNMPRPSAALDRYLEGRNVWTSGAHTPINQFETFLRTTGRNDKLAVVAP